MTDAESRRPLQAALQKLQGIRGSSLSTERAAVDYDSTETSVEDIVMALREGTPYSVTEEQASETQEMARAVVRVEGLTSAREASEITAKVGRPGILGVRVDVDASTLTFDYDPAALRPLELLAAVQEVSDRPVTLLAESGASESDQAGSVETGWNAAKYAVWGAAALFLLTVAGSGAVWAGRRRHGAERRGAGPSAGTAQRGKRKVRR